MCAHDPRCAGPSPEVRRHACRENVARHGWHCTGVFGDSETPPFAYTTGLWRTRQHPELVIAGLDPKIGHDVLAAAVRLIEEGETLTGGQDRRDIVEGFAARIREVDLARCAAPFTDTDEFEAKPGTPRLQILWPDPQGRFPGDDGCDPGMAASQQIGG